MLRRGITDSSRLYTLVWIPLQRARLRTCLHFIGSSHEAESSNTETTRCAQFPTDEKGREIVEWDGPDDPDNPSVDSFT